MFVRGLVFSMFVLSSACTPAKSVGANTQATDGAQAQESEKPLDVSASFSDGKVTISFKTKQDQSSVCELTVKEMKVSNKRILAPGQVGIPGGGSAVLDLTAEVLPNARCQKMIGPHAGEATFQIEGGLPSLASDGVYKVIINGQQYGGLDISKSQLVGSMVFFD